MKSTKNVMFYDIKSDEMIILVMFYNYLEPEGVVVSSALFCVGVIGATSPFGF